ncbi:hypothetical protein QW180_18220 [Vibrio sinaloensis]|nr:hypothetical protein [Vibrio sinaloensis]
MPNSLDYLLAEESLVVADYFSLPGSFGRVKPNLVRVSSNMVKLAEGKKTSWSNLQSVLVKHAMTLKRSLQVFTTLSIRGS